LCLFDFYFSSVVVQQEVKLVPLLELNDHVSSVLTKADRIAQTEKDNNDPKKPRPTMKTVSKSSSLRSHPLLSPLSPPTNTSNSNKEDSKKSNTTSITSNSVVAVDNTANNMQNIVNAVYALRRVADREETLIAVENLISICELEGEVKIWAVKQMMTAGALQVLLSVLSRANEWPEVEMQISKVVSVLVAYEADWTLLQRSALAILSSLYTLQLKTQSRARSRSEALANRNNMNTMMMEPPAPSMIEAMSSMSLSESQSNYSSDRLSISTHGLPAYDSNSNNAAVLMIVEQQQSQDIRALVSAAVAKLSLVLSSEWSKQELPFGEFPIPVGISSTISNSFQHGLDRVEKMRSLITRHSKSITSRHPSLNDGVSTNMDSNRVLQVLLNLILTISEAQLTTLESYELEPVSASRTPNLKGNLSLDSLAYSLPPVPVPATIYRSNSYEQTYNKIDSFLTSTFGINFYTLLNHSLIQIKPKLVDNSAVLCSRALVNLAEVMACRPGLVAGGALRVIKSWLEIGVHILKYGYLICNDYAGQIYNVQQFQEFFLVLFGPVYELIANATAALMLLAGGSSDSKASHTAGVYFSPSNPLQSGGGRDYIIGWIDAQILAEGLPEVLVNIIIASHETFLIDKNTSTSANIPPPPPTVNLSTSMKSTSSSNQSPEHNERKKGTILSTCILPGQISKNIAKFLFQICSRPQNRHRLQGSSIPYILSLIFERSVSVVKYTIDQTLALDNEETTASTIASQSQSNSPLGENRDHHYHHHSPKSSNINLSAGTSCSNPNSLSPLPATSVNNSSQHLNELFRKVFEFGMQEAQSNKHDSHHHHDHHHPTDHKKNDPKLPELKKQSSMESASSRFFGSFLSHKKEHNDSSHEEQQHQQQQQQKGHSSNNPSQYKISAELMDMMSLITAACLDTIGYYFGDEISRQQMFAPQQQTILQLRASVELLHSLSSSIANFNFPLIQLMCHPRIMAAILMATSNLQKGVGRLAAIRIIASLTEWPDSIIALYEGSIMHALLLIASEVEADLAASNRVSESKYNYNNQGNNNYNTSNHNNNNLDVRSVSTRSYTNERISDPNATSAAANLFPPKPLPAKRNTSNNSTISEISSNNSVSRKSHSFHRISNMFGISDNSNHPPGYQTTSSTPHSVSHLEDYIIDDEELLHADMVLEETLYVCYSLANLCLANNTYAYRMFTSGLLSIMLKLVKSTHLEISHQALRCMHAMCTVIARNDHDELGNLISPPPPATTTTSGNTLPLTSANIHSTSFKSSSSPRTNNRQSLRDLLDILTELIKSPSPLVLNESILTLSQLCLVSEEFRDKIMDGCMRSIVLILVNPTYAREQRSAAEEVLKNCGFQSGLKDFEVCGFDYEILKEWYFLKRSLKPQEAAKRLLNVWIDRLFTENEPLYGRQSLLFAPSTEDGGGIASGGNTADPNYYQFSLANEIAELWKVSQFTYTKHHDTSNSLMSGAPLGFPHLHRQFTDSLFKLLPICFPKFSGNSSETSPQRGFSDELDAAYGTNSYHNRNSSMSSHSRDSYGGNNPNNNNNPGGAGFTMNRSTYSPAMLTRDASNHHHGSSVEYYSWIDRPPLVVTNMFDMFYFSKLHQALIMDLTSVGVCIPVTSPAEQNNNNHNDRDSDDEEERLADVDEFLTEELAFLIPHPHPVYAILLPSRTYQSFSRVGKVLQRMFEQGDINQLYALSFRDCEYHGDFHTSLLATLQRCPQICSISFSSTSRVEDDALLGHLVGQIPSTVRFLSFRSTLSHESIQALCILLRTHNAAFLNATDNDDFFDRNSGGGPSRHSSFRGTVVNEKAGLELKTFASPSPVHEKMASATPSSETTPSNTQPATTPFNTAIPLHSNKGILGLALTHLSLEGPEIQHIVELLQPRMHSQTFAKTPRSYKSGGPGGPGTTPSSTSFSTINTPASLKRAESQTSSNSPGNTPKSAFGTTGGSGGFGKMLSSNKLSTAEPLNGNHHHFLRGLKYLDLSYNNLSDADCSTIFKAALNGPLEGLELAGNSLNKAVKFIDTLTMISSARQLALNPNRLRLLGLSNNNLSNKAFTGILYKLVDNTSLTTLDLSINNIDSSATNNESLRSFIKKNNSLRFLDLSHNRLSPESYRIMHLGLLENSNLLMMPLYGNQGVEISPTVELIQQKLRENRLIYKSQSKDYSYGFIRNEMDQVHYQTEDISARISFSGINDYLVTSAVPAVPPAIAEENNLLLQQGGLGGESEKIPFVQVDTVENNHLFDEQHQKDTTITNPTHAEVGVMASDRTIDSQHSIHSGLSSTNSTVADGKKLTLLHPVDGGGSLTLPLMINNTGTNVAIAVAVPSPRTNPSTPSKQQQRFSGKYFFEGGNSSSAAFTVVNNNANSSNNSVASASNNPNNNMMTTQEGNNNNNVLVASENSKPGSVSGDVIAAAPVPLTNFSSHTLNVLFSAPLAGFDRSGKAHPLEVLDYTSERDTLIQVFKEVHRDIAVHFDFATTDTLRTILSFGCKALHFSGHGVPKGLCFEDGKSGLQVIREQQLKDLLSAGGLSLEFVFVSACFSKEIGEAFIKAGVSHVVCVKIDSKIQDAAAMAFTRAFYVAFLSGKTVKASFDIAKEALKLSPYVPDGVFEGDKFILLPEIGHPKSLEQKKPSGESTTSTNSGPPPVVVDAKYHDNSLFANRSSIDWPQLGQCTIGPNRTDLKQFLSRIRIPSQPSDFEGRECIMNSLIRNIVDRRFISLVGEDGVGKSSVAAAICKYMADREFFADGMVYLKAKGLKDFPSFLHALKHGMLTSGNNPVSKRLSELLHQHHVPSHGHPHVPHAHAHHHHSTVLTTSATNTTVVSSTTAVVSPSATLEDEEMIFSCLENMRLLIVMDHLDDLVADFSEATTYLRLFLNRLFEQCPHVKILNVSTDTLSMFNISIGLGIVEYSVSLGPLTLNSSLRLFARLAPSLITIHEKLEFIECLQPPKQFHVTIHSREISNAALQILQLFGEGHPAKIVHMACESTHESVEELKKIGKRIIQQSMGGAALLDHHHHHHHHQHGNHPNIVVTSDR
jgi:hypothetical protein